MTRSLAILAATLPLLIATQFPSASADDTYARWALNGVFHAQSNGDFATTNDIFLDETTVEATWTISTTCTSPSDCEGTVQSDSGWKERIYQTADMWHIWRSLPNWQPCPDGTAAPGRQEYRFYPTSEKSGGMQDFTQMDQFAGIDETSGPSGACGINKPLVISMPLRLNRIS